MKIACISDLHIKNENGSSFYILTKFIEHPDVQDADTVIFLGDIFDLFIGNHRKYLAHYPGFFSLLKQLLIQNKRVYYFSGNHDFHIGGVFKSFIKDAGLDSSLFTYHTQAIELEINHRKYIFMHGDELDFSVAYNRWKRIYSSSWFGFIVNKILTGSFILRLGGWAARDSRKRNKKSFDFKAAKELFRKNFEFYIGKQKEVTIIAGHTHIRDDYEFNTCRYINGGNPNVDKTFIKISDSEVLFVPL